MALGRRATAIKDTLRCNCAMSDAFVKAAGCTIDKQQFTSEQTACRDWESGYHSPGLLMNWDRLRSEFGMLSLDLTAHLQEFGPNDTFALKCPLGTLQAKFYTRPPPENTLLGVEGV